MICFKIFSGLWLILVLICFPTEAMLAQLALEMTFHPSERGALCVVAHDECAGELWVYNCSDAVIDLNDFSGMHIKPTPMARATSIDFDSEIAPVDFIMSTTLAGPFPLNLRKVTE